MLCYPRVGDVGCAHQVFFLLRLKRSSAGGDTPFIPPASVRGVPSVFLLYGDTTEAASADGHAPPGFSMPSAAGALKPLERSEYTWSIAPLLVRTAPELTKYSLSLALAIVDLSVTRVAACSSFCVTSADEIAWRDDTAGTITLDPMNVLSSLIAGSPSVAFGTTFPAQDVVPPSSVTRRSLWLIARFVVDAAAAGAVLALALAGGKEQPTPPPPPPRLASPPPLSSGLFSFSSIGRRRITSQVAFFDRRALCPLFALEPSSHLALEANNATGVWSTAPALLLQTVTNPAALDRGLLGSSDGREIGDIARRS